MKKLFYLFLLSLIISSCGKQQTTHTQSLNENWFFEYNNNWYEAQVPGVIHTDLLNNKHIKQPFYGSNEDSLQWIGDSVWIYKKEFTINSVIKNADNIDLCFDGLDTYAKVWLNDSLVLETANMFRAYQTPVKELLKEKNKLKVCFYPAEKIQDSISKLFPYQLPDVRSYTRKAPYHFGWDWGPKFVTAGIWKDVKLVYWNTLIIENISYATVAIENGVAKVNAEIQYQAQKDCEANILIKDHNTTYYNKSIRLDSKSNKASIQFDIENPTLWWPNGMGDQYCYTLKAEITANDDQQSFTQNIGIRTIELEQKKDSIGSNFAFIINGKKAFIKGANYIPQHSFLPSVSANDYEQVLQAAVDANMNMLRVWGGGFYENDLFYELCTKKGLLVWQDFMFACTMYPGHDAFLENAKEEFIQNVDRIKGNSCIALWCGNNEISEGWHNWGWQKALNYSASDSSLVYHHYDTLFHHIIPKVLNASDPYRPYWPSSPSYGWGRSRSLKEGDIHYWGVWWGAEPFAMYKQKVGRFMSEYGYQSFPGLTTIKKYIPKEEQYLNAPMMKTHQKHPRGAALIQEYMERNYSVPKRFDDYIYLSQVLQAEGMKIAVEAHRRAMPYCMGTLYWQLNDCWPVISWSSIDFDKKWKAFHYFTKDMYKNLIITNDTVNKHVQTKIVNDHYETKNYLAEIVLMKNDGEILMQKSVEKKLTWGSHTIFDISVDEFPKGFKPENTFLLSKVYENGELLDLNTFYFNKIKDFQLSEVTPKIEIQHKTTHSLLMISADKLIKNLYLHTDDEGFFEDNYFDVVPGEQYAVKYFNANTGHKLDLDKLLYKSINNLNKKVKTLR